MPPLWNFYSNRASRASNQYKNFLRDKIISYIIAGENQLDLKLVLHKLYTLFEMERLMLGGGRTLNWSFLQEGLVDKISIIVAAIADGSTSSQTLFMAQSTLSIISSIAFKNKKCRSFRR